MTVLATSFKAQLPADLSYPIGAEAISAALAGVPQLDGLKLSFHVHAGLWMSQFRRVIREGEPLTVVSVSYQNLKPGLSGSNAFIEEGWYTESWEMTLYAVPRLDKHSARAAIEQSLPRVCSWLTAPRSQTWRYGRHHLSVHVRLPEGELTYAET